nr:methyltransferase domain-containing protein [Ndongobacter massiliensis]
MLRASVTELPFESEHFDAVTTFETVYFWHDLPQCFQEVWR